MSKNERQTELIWMIQKHGITAKAIAEICGVNVSTVYGWTTGNMGKVIPEKQLLKLKAAFL